MRDHENENHIVNCGHYNKLWDYEISDGVLGHTIGTFHKEQIV